MKFELIASTITLLCLLSIQVTSESCNFNGNVRLTNTRIMNSSTYSLLQWCNGTMWEGVCDYNWQCDHAVVACRQLGNGYSSNNRIQYLLNFGSTNSFGFGPFSYCSSSDSSLSRCSMYSSSYRNNPTYCNLTKDTVGLNCNVMFSECTSGSVRLVDNNGQVSTREGRIEYCHDGKWSPICTRHTMNHITASNLCFELGYRSNSFASVFRDGRFGRASSQNWFRYISCSSSSRNSLSQCSFYSNSCPEPCSSSYHHYGIRCHDPVSCTEGSIRLVNGTVLNEGRLEVCTNGVWGSVCSSSFGSTDAIVVCRELGYNSGGSVNTNSVFGSGDGPIVYNSFGCAGYEKKLIDCSKSTYLSFTCDRTNLVGVSCWDGCTDGDVRLTGGSKTTEGTVEICRNHVWGLISQVGWKDENSQVVCDQLGYENEDAESVYDSMFGKPNRTVYLTSVDCDGLEDRLIDCSVGDTYTFDAGKLLLPHVQVIGVRCQGNETYRTLDYYSISVSSVHHFNTTGSITITPHITDGLSRRENAVIGVGGTMIIIAIIAIITVIIVIVYFIRIQRKRVLNSRNYAIDMNTLTQDDKLTTVPNHCYQTTQASSETARPMPPQKPRSKPHLVAERKQNIEVIYD